jgi:flagellin-like protein
MKRRALSPILAEVMLIAITLIAGVALTGFVFGTLGSYTSNSLATVSSAACVSSGDNVVYCAITASNMGGGTTAVDSIVAIYGSPIRNETQVPAVGINLPAGGSTTFYCVFTNPGGPFTLDSTLSGLVYLSNGGVVPWTTTIYSSA